MQGLPSLLGVIEVTANRYLRLDPDAFSALLEFADRVIALDIHGLHETVFLHFTSDGVSLTLSLDQEADARVRATPVSLLRSLKTRGVSDITFDSGIEVDGDTGLVLGVKNVFDRVDVDWEEELSHLIGDVAAHQVGNIYRRAEQWGEKTWSTLLQDTAEYLLEEGRLTPRQDEIIAFVEAVDSLRDDTERLAQRVQRLLDGKVVRQS